MHLVSYLQLAERTSRHLATEFRAIADAHPDDPETSGVVRILAGFAERDADALGPALERYADTDVDGVERLHPTEPAGSRGGGGVGLLRDLQDVHARATLADMNWTIVGQTARALRDDDLVAVVGSAQHDLERQLNWLLTRIKQVAPQAVLMT